MSVSRSFELPLASAGPIFVALFLHHYLRGASFQVSLDHVELLSIISERIMLTQSSLFDLLYCKGDGREQFD